MWGGVGEERGSFRKIGGQGRTGLGFCEKYGVEIDILIGNDKGE
jgi:hypothetical protein